MLKRSYLTSIIGFLFGTIMYLFIEANTIMIFLFGGLGYFIGMILDNGEVKHQLDTYYFTTIPTTQEIFYPDDIPGSYILYSPKENLTTAVIDFRVDTKPQDFRLSILKNLQDYEFRVIEDTEKTMFSLTLEFPNCNYPKLILNNETSNIHFDIKERGCDFKEAMQKIVPGIVLVELQNPDIFGNERSNQETANSFESPFSSNSSSGSNSLDSNRSSDSYDGSTSSHMSHKYPPDSPNYDKKTIFKELIDYPPMPDTDETDQELLISSENQNNTQPKVDIETHSSNYSLNHKDEEIIDETEIMDDLLNTPKRENDSPIMVKVSNFTSEESEQFVDTNDHKFDRFLSNNQINALKSNNDDTGLLTADKIAKMSNAIPTYSDPNEKDEDATKEEDLLVKSNMANTRDKKNNSTEEEQSSNKKVNLDDEGEEEILAKANNIKIDFSAISGSNDTSESDTKLNEFDNIIVGRLDAVIKKTTDMENIKDEVKNIRRGLHPNSIQSQES